MLRYFSILVAIFWCCHAATAQRVDTAANLVDAPSATQAAHPVPITTHAIQISAQPNFVPHAFTDRKNVAFFTMSVLGQTADAVTTQRGLHHGRYETNPIAKPFVDQGWAGQIGLAVIVNGAQLGVMYWAHRRGHHRLERGLPIAVGVASGVAAFSNLQRGY